MSGVTLAGALGVMTSSPANAGGLYEESLKDAPIAPPVAIWTGCYVGGHAGGAWGDDDLELKKKKHRKHDDPSKALTNTKAITSEKKHHGPEVKSDDDDVVFIGGVHAGCNWQENELVYGLEGDVSFGDDIDYLASVRGRLGVAVDQLLVYATAGVAFMGAEEDFEIVSRRHTHKFTKDTDEVGFVVGGGAEMKLDTNWSFGVEGLYYLFDEDSEKYTMESKKQCRKGKEHGYEVEDDEDIFVIRARLSYHFSPEPAPLPPLK